jgi:hypothetical protein
LQPLEIQLQGKLNNPWIHTRAGDLAERCRIRDECTREAYACVQVRGIRKLGRIECIEEFRSKVEIKSLTGPLQQNSLDQGNVKIVLGRSSNNSDTDIAEIRASIRRYNGGPSDAGRIEIVVESAGDGSGCGQLADLAPSRKLRPVLRCATDTKALVTFELVMVRYCPA